MERRDRRRLRPARFPGSPEPLHRSPPGRLRNPAFPPRSPPAGLAEGCHHPEGPPRYPPLVSLRREKVPPQCPEGSAPYHPPSGHGCSCAFPCARRGTPRRRAVPTRNPPARFSSTGRPHRSRTGEPRRLRAKPHARGRTFLLTRPFVIPARQHRTFDERRPFQAARAPPKAGSAVRRTRRARPGPARCSRPRPSLHLSGAGQRETPWRAAERAP